MYHVVGFAVRGGKFFCHGIIHFFKTENCVEKTQVRRVLVRSGFLAFLDSTSTGLFAPFGQLNNSSTIISTKSFPVVDDCCYVKINKFKMSLRTPIRCVVYPRH